MEISMSSQVQIELKRALTSSGKSAARFIANGIGCRGPLFDIEFSDQKEGDVVTEAEGIAFVTKRAYAIALKKPEIVKQGDKFIVKRTACGC